MQRVLDLGTLDISNGFALSEFVNSNAPTSFGNSAVSAAGDFNGDGINDVVVTSAKPFATESSGSIYVVFGRDTAFSAVESLTDLSSSQGVVIEDLGGPLPKVNDVGDINNDGFDDIAVGTGGKSYVVFGSNAGFADGFGLEDLDGSNVFVFQSGGTSVSGAGDFNGDGIDDLIVGNPNANPAPTSVDDFARGESYVVLGRDTGFDASITRADLTGRQGFVIKGVDINGSSGATVSNAGDMNGDGFDDVIIGAPDAGGVAVGRGSRSPGAAYVVFGRSSVPGAEIDLAELDGSNGFVFSAADRFGNAGLGVSAAGDINNDGFDDAIVEATAKGFVSIPEAYVIYGKSTGFEATVRPNGDVNDTLTISASPISSSRGTTGGGDINGDGIDDLVGSSFVLFGQDSGSSNVPVVNDKLATIYVGADGNIIGDAFFAGEPYQGLLLSNTDNSINANDAIAGTSGNDTIWAGTQGNDAIASGDGDDIIGFGDGNDIQVQAGNGNDVVYAIGSRGGSHTVDLGSGTDNFYAVAGRNTITGSGNNLIAVGSDADSVTTQDGDDFVYSAGEPDLGFSNSLDLGGGNNTVWVQTGNYDIITGNASDPKNNGNDIVGLGTGTHSVSTGSGDDVVYMANSTAVNGNNTIFTGDGDDFIQTGAGDDLLDGGKGLNSLYGGAGSDTFTIRTDAYNFLADFELGRDRINLFGLSPEQLDFVQGSADTGTANSTFIFVNNIGIAEVTNSTVATLENVDNFVYTIIN